MSPKHRFYFERLRAARKIMLPFISDGHSHYLKEWRTYLMIPRDVRLNHYDRYLVASFPSLVFAMLMGRHQASIDMFDDGLMNLLPSEILPRLEAEPLLQRWTKRAFGALSSCELVNSVDLHYTIYRPQDLIVGHDRAIKLDVFEAPDRVFTNSGSLRILLGTPIETHEGETTSEILDYYAIYRQLPCDIFIAHPSEKLPSHVYETVPDAQYWRDIVTTYIAEDVIRQLRNKGFSLEVMGIASSTIVNIAGISSVINVTIPGVNDVDLDVYDRLGILSMPLSSLR